jgi:energy-coupling factor transport system ATP-binding protein
MAAGRQHRMTHSNSAPSPASDLIRIVSLSYVYPGASQPALHEVSLSIGQGEVVLLTGPSGSGKSTLLRAFNGLVPHFTGGRIGGSVRVANLDPVRKGPAPMSGVVGMVFQDPESQFVVDRVEDEIAFALENAAVPREEMRQRINDVLRWLDIEHLRDRVIGTLSGGEGQRVAIASALAMRPKVLALDEPTSQLDEDSAADVLNAIAKLNRELGLTIVLSEHRLERVTPFATRTVRLAAGQLTEHETRKAEEIATSHTTRHAAPSQQMLRVTDLYAGYDGRVVLRGAHLDVRAGEVVALMGRNGSGKSTLLKSIVGLTPMMRGEIKVMGRSIAGRDTADICREAAYLPQNPNTLLFADTVGDELNITRRNHALPPFSANDARAMLATLGIARYAQAYPRDLSVGERQRAALGAVTAAHPGLLLLDEPTRGLDAESKHKLANMLRHYAEDGVGVLLVTHDHALVEMCADRVVVLDNGVIRARGT